MTILNFLFAILVFCYITRYQIQYRSQQLKLFNFTGREEVDSAMMSEVLCNLLLESAV